MKRVIFAAMLAALGACGDAAPSASSVAVQVADDHGGLDLVSTGMQLRLRLTGCASGKTATVDTPALLQVINGDRRCSVLVDSITATTATYLPMAPPSATVGVTTAYKTADGRMLMLTPTAALPDPIDAAATIGYRISAIDAGPSAAVDVALPQDACTIVFAAASFVVRVHPAYLRAAASLETKLFPCGDANTKGKACKASGGALASGVVYANAFTSTAQGPLEHSISVATATLTLSDAALTKRAKAEGKSLACRAVY